LKRIPNDAVESAIGECLRSVNMLDSAATRVGALSGGMLRRVGIAGALLADPEVLLFDEPTAGLDPEERVRFKRLVSTLAETRTVLISTHIVEDIEALAGVVIVLHHGTVAAAGTLEEIASLARGMCYLAPRDIVNEHADDYYVDEYTEVDGAHFAMILSPRAYPGFVNRDPSFQDGYLCVTRGLT
jgi:ABC-2 type transport system ATP-binding protein